MHYRFRPSYRDAIDSFYERYICRFKQSKLALQNGNGSLEDYERARFAAQDAIGQIWQTRGKSVAGNKRGIQVKYDDSGKRVYSMREVLLVSWTTELRHVIVV